MNSNLNAETNQQYPSVSNENVRTNPDGSVDVLFGGSIGASKVCFTSEFRSRAGEMSVS